MEDGGGGFGLILGLILAVPTIIAVWKVFAKAGQPGWAIFVPIYGTIVHMRIAGKPWWWLLLFFIPFVNIVIYFMVSVAVAKRFGKGTLFGIFFLGIFSFVGYLILGFGSATYSNVSNTTLPQQPAPPPQTPLQS